MARIDGPCPPGTRPAPAPTRSPRSRRTFHGRSACFECRTERPGPRGLRGLRVRGGQAPGASRSASARAGEAMPTGPVSIAHAARQRGSLGSPCGGVVRDGSRPCVGASSISAGPERGGGPPTVEGRRAGRHGLPPSGPSQLGTRVLLDGPGADRRPARARTGMEERKTPGSRALEFDGAVPASAARVRAGPGPRVPGPRRRWWTASDAPGGRGGGSRRRASRLGARRDRPVGRCSPARSKATGPVLGPTSRLGRVAHGCVGTAAGAPWLRMGASRGPCRRSVLPAGVAERRPDRTVAAPPSQAVLRRAGEAEGRHASRSPAGRPALPGRPPRGEAPQDRDGASSRAAARRTARRPAAIRTSARSEPRPLRPHGRWRARGDSPSGRAGRRAGADVPPVIRRPARAENPGAGPDVGPSTHDGVRPAPRDHRVPEAGPDALVGGSVGPVLGDGADAAGSGPASRGSRRWARCDPPAMPADPCSGIETGPTPRPRGRTRPRDPRRRGCPSAPGPGSNPPRRATGGRSAAPRNEEGQALRDHRPGSLGHPPRSRSRGSRRDPGRGGRTPGPGFPSSVWPHRRGSEAAIEGPATSGRKRTRGPIPPMHPEGRAAAPAPSVGCTPGPAGPRAPPWRSSPPRRDGRSQPRTRRSGPHPGALAPGKRRPRGAGALHRRAGRDVRGARDHAPRERRAGPDGTVAPEWPVGRVNRRPTDATDERIALRRGVRTGDGAGGDHPRCVRRR